MGEGKPDHAWRHGLGWLAVSAALFALFHWHGPGTHSALNQLLGYFLMVVSAVAGIATITRWTPKS